MSSLLNIYSLLLEGILLLSGSTFSWRVWEGETLGKFFGVNDRLNCLKYGFTWF